MFFPYWISFTGKDIKLTKEAMKVMETQLERVPNLDKWFVEQTYRLNHHYSDHSSILPNIAKRGNHTTCQIVNTLVGEIYPIESWLSETKLLFPRSALSIEAYLVCYEAAHHHNT